MNTIFDIEQKQDSPEKLAAVANKETKYILFAHEFNEIVESIKKTILKLKNFTSLNDKIGIHNDNPQATLDVKNSPPLETALTGTFSFDGFTLQGIGTLMLSELQQGDTIKVISTGNTYTINDIMNETMAFSLMGGKVFNNQVCSLHKINKKILNINDFFEVGYNDYGEPQILFKARVLSQNGTVEIQTENINNFQNNYGPKDGQMGTSYSFPQGYPKFSCAISKESDNLYWYRVSNSVGNKYIAFSENGDIKLYGLSNSGGDSTFTKQLVAKYDGTLGWQDKNVAAGDWVNLTLVAPATANKARYRIKGDTVQLELYILRVNGVGKSQFAFIPISITPTGFTDGMFVHGYDVSTSQTVMMRIGANGALTVITNTNTNGLVFTVQWKIF